MAFDYFGTFTTSQWLDFRDFTEIQKVELEGRRRWLSAQLAGTGQVSCTYDEDNMIPVEFSAAPNTYIGKLLLAYRMLGGIPERNMLLRTRDKVVFLKRGATGEDAPGYTNGRMDRGTQRYDRSLGLRVERLKKWQIEIIKSKREVDYADQLEQELILVNSLIDDSGVDSQILAVELSIDDPNTYRLPMGGGNPKDLFGLQIGKQTDMTTVNAGNVAIANKERVPQGVKT
jgi:hypothetical protein